jgi:hypothetical protein
MLAACCLHPKMVVALFSPAPQVNKSLSGSINLKSAALIMPGKPQYEFPATFKTFLGGMCLHDF